MIHSTGEQEQDGESLITCELLFNYYGYLFEMTTDQLITTRKRRTLIPKRLHRLFPTCRIRHAHQCWHSFVVQVEEIPIFFGDGHSPAVGHAQIPPLGLMYPHTEAPSAALCYAAGGGSL